MVYHSPNLSLPVILLRSQGSFIRKLALRCALSSSDFCLPGQVRNSPKDCTCNFLYAHFTGGPVIQAKGVYVEQARNTLSVEKQSI